MRVLIISDIHANFTALEAVLQVASDYEAVWCLGDLVGYGPDPNECVERVRELPELICLIGNHDQAALGTIPISRFNRDAGAAAAWTQEELTEKNREYLLSLPSKVVVDQYTLAHASPNQPIWEYILDPMTADRNFDGLETDFCLVGHSHLPLIFHRPTDNSFAVHRPVAWGEQMELIPRMIVNPGSVGQPRDGDARASYAILDQSSQTWEALRVEYDVEAVQDRILDAGLPERHALRLMVGW